MWRWRARRKAETVTVIAIAETDQLTEGRVNAAPIIRYFLFIETRVAIGLTKSWNSVRTFEGIFLLFAVSNARFPESLSL